MTKKFEFDWHLPVPEPLLTGCVFDRWTEEKDNTELEQAALFKVDEYGFFIYWKSEGKEGDVIELCQVSDIRAGGVPLDRKLLNTLEKKHGPNLDERSLTICSGTDYININYQHMVCPDAQTAKVWQEGLRRITHNNKSTNVCPRTVLLKHWMRLGFLVDPKGKVPVKVVARTFASGKTEKLVYQCLSELGLPSGKNDVMENEDFTFDKFYALYHKICPRNDIEELFREIGQNKEHISLEQFVNFLNEKQRDPRLNEILYPMYDEKRASEIIATYEQDEAAKKENKLTKDGLIRYLMSDENAPVFLDRLDIYMEMDQPLCAYYINSSHNTYLVGRQFGGKSSVEMYRQVLLAGCRCVELDCWDGRGEDEEPIITHGKAMCTDISFKDVIYAIRDTAFVTSDYPVILSFENHCCKAQQYKMAKYCDEILGDLLLKEPLDEFPLDAGMPLPSPSHLKRKILIKNKRLKPEVEKQELELFRQGQFIIEDEEKEDASAPSADRPIPPDIPAEVPATEPTADGDAPPPIQYTGSTTNVHPWLSSMVMPRSVGVPTDDLDYADTNGVVKHADCDLLPNNNVCGPTECYSRSPECANSDGTSFGGGKDDSQDSLESTASSTSQNSEYKVYPSVMQNDSSSISELPSTSPKDISDGVAIEKRVQYNADVNNGVVEKPKAAGRKRNANASRGRPRKAIVAMYHSQISGDKNTIKIRIKKSNLSTQLTPNKKKSGRRKKHKTSDTDASDHETNSKRSKSSVSNDVINERDSFGPLDHSRWGTDLPNEILHNIFRLVVGNDGALPILVRLCKVCRQWREIALSPSLWKKVDLNWVTERARTDLTLHWMIQNRLTLCHDLNLGEWKVRDIQLALEALSQYCPELRGLNLSGWKGLNADNLKYITTECEKLQRIDLSSINSTSAINAQPLVNLGQTMNSRLTHLVLAHNKIAGFTQIMASIAGNCPNLELLDISNIRTFAHNTALLHVEKLQIGCSKLRVLRITNSQIWLAPASIQLRIQSPGFPCLEELSLAGIEDDQTTTARCVDDDGIERILKNSTKLRLLDVRGCIRLTDSGLVKVPAWDLEHLFLSACYITRTQYSGMELIVQKWSHSLMEVDLAWSTATASLDAAVMALAEKGSESPLRTINLCGSSVSLEPVKAILTKCPNLHSINLQSCRALPRGIKRLYTGKAVNELRQSLQDKPKTEQSDTEADQPSTEQPAP